jgi:hypothetical protein
VGEVTAKDLARHFGSLDALMAADVAALQGTPDVGPIVAESIAGFFREKHNREVIEQLRAAGVHWPEGEGTAAKAPSGPFAGKIVVLTGTLGIPRDDAKALIEEAGGAHHRVGVEEDRLRHRRRRGRQQAGQGERVGHHRARRRPIPEDAGPPMTPTKVTKAVFPVAGLGTRFLPATKASPKEMLTVVDKPLIQYAVEEAVAAGITDMIFVTGAASAPSRTISTRPTSSKPSCRPRARPSC